MTATPSHGLAELRAAWVAELPEDGDHTAWTGLLQDCLERHEDRARHYHGVSHLVAVHRSLVALTHKVDDVLLAATVLHDFIYDAERTDNEAMSALHAVAALTPTGMSARKIAVVSEIIEATAQHALPDPVRAPERVTVFLDADLSILGAPPDVYQKYSEQIRSEYAHVPDADFRTGRVAVLSAFLKRSELFFTPKARTLWERSARANLAAEIATLSGES